MQKNEEDQSSFQIISKHFQNKIIIYEDILILSYVISIEQVSSYKYINHKSILQNLKKYNINNISGDIISHQAFVTAFKILLISNKIYNVFDVDIATFNKYGFQLFCQFMSENMIYLQLYQTFNDVLLSIKQVKNDDVFIMLVFMIFSNFTNMHNEIIDRLSQINVQQTIYVLQNNAYIVENDQSLKQLAFNGQQIQPEKYVKISRVFKQLCIYYSFNILLQDEPRGLFINYNSKPQQMYFNQDLLNLLNFLACYFNLTSNLLNVKQYLDSQAEIYFMQHFDPNTLCISKDYASDQMVKKADEIIQRSNQYKQDKGLLSLYHYNYLLTMSIKQRMLRFNPLSIDTTEFSVNRNQISTDILSQFYQYNQGLQMQQIIEYQHNKLEMCQLITHQHIYIAFKYEDGVDAGGLSKEVFNVLVDNLVTEDYWLFRQIGTENSHFYWPDQTSQNDQQLLEQDYTLLGVVFGICLLNGFLIDDYFPNLFYYLLYNEDIDLEMLIDMTREIDQEFVDNLLKLKQYKDIPDLEDIIQQTFSFTIEQYDENHLIELKENGNNIYVNNDNVDEYIELRLYKTFYNTFHQKAFSYMRKGLRLVIFQFKLDFFSPQEIRQALCGDEINISQLQEITVYEAPYNENHQIIIWFWEILREFDNEHKKMFLKFMFSTPRMDTVGFQKFEIQRNGDSNGYPVAHTCNSTLDLPEYTNKEILKERLLFSVQFCEGFGVI